jgi:hypothetical protein
MARSIALFHQPRNEEQARSSAGNGFGLLHGCTSPATRKQRGSEESESANWSAMGDREDDISRRDWLSDKFNVIEANFRENLLISPPVAERAESAPLNVPFSPCGVLPGSLQRTMLDCFPQLIGSFFGFWSRRVNDQAST